LLQPEVFHLMKRLCDEGYIVSLETGGSLDTRAVDPRVHTILDIKCPGSGMSEKNFWKNLTQLRAHDEVKFVLLNEEDYHYAVDVCNKWNLFKTKQTVLFSPVHGELDPKNLIDWMLRDQIPVRLNLQVHKYIWTPETQGV